MYVIQINFKELEVYIFVIGVTKIDSWVVVFRQLDKKQLQLANSWLAEYA